MSDKTQRHANCGTIGCSRHSTKRLVNPCNSRNNHWLLCNPQGAPKCLQLGRHRSFVSQLIVPHAADHFWWTDDPLESATDFFQPNEYSPHCLPCHWTPDHEQQAVGDGEKYQPFTPYTGCPCTLEHICRHDTRKLYKEACDGPLDHLPFRSDTICLRQLHTSPVLQLCFGFDAAVHWLFTWVN